jgi:hypothetical protein
MGLDGGGGGGTILGAGNAFTGTAQALEIIGDHCYALSGSFAQLTSEQTLFNFTSGNYYVVATLTLTAPIFMDSTNIVSGGVRGWQLDFNGQPVGLYKAESDQEDMPTMIEAQILIPPFTAVTLVCIDNVNNANFLGTANITGRIYR